MIESIGQASWRRACRTDHRTVAPGAIARLYTSTCPPERTSRHGLVRPALMSFIPRANDASKPGMERSSRVAEFSCRLLTNSKNSEATCNCVVDRSSMSALACRLSCVVLMIKVYPTKTHASIPAHRPGRGTQSNDRRQNSISFRRLRSSATRSSHSQICKLLSGTTKPWTDHLGCLHYAAYEAHAPVDREGRHHSRRH